MMKLLRSGLRLGLAVLAVAVCASPALGAEPVEQAICIVTDEEGRPVEGVKVHVCGEERRLPDGSWGRNHSPDCVLPRASMGKAGRFTVPFDEKDVRVNLWVAKDGFAPTFVAGLSPQPQGVKVIMKRGLQVSGQVNRLVQGKLEPVKGAAVYLGCSSGDAAHQKRVFEDPYFFVMKMQEGDDLPYLQTVFTGYFGEYVFQLSPPPKDKKWFVVCLDEMAPLDVREGQATKGPDFVVQVQVREPGKSGVQAAVPSDGK
jgi:hypothetical protein